MPAHKPPRSPARVLPCAGASPSSAFYVIQTAAPAAGCSLAVGAGPLPVGPSPPPRLMMPPAADAYATPTVETGRGRSEEGRSFVGGGRSLLAASGASVPGRAFGTWQSDSLPATLDGIAWVAGRLLGHIDNRLSVAVYWRCTGVVKGGGSYHPRTPKEVAGWH